MNFEKGAADVAGSDRGSILFIQFVELRGQTARAATEKSQSRQHNSSSDCCCCELLLQARNHMSLWADGRSKFSSQHARLAHTHTLTSPGCSKRCTPQGVSPPLTCHEIYGAYLQLEKFAAAVAMIIFAVNVLFMSLATRLLLESTLHISGDMITGSWIQKLIRKCEKFQPWLKCYKKECSVFC